MRIGSLLAAAWAGVLFAIAALVMPAAFAALPVAEAGRLAAGVFAREAPFSLALAAVLYVVARREARAAAAAGRGSLASVEVLLVFGALFCTVAGYYALQPMMEQARAGLGALVVRRAACRVARLLRAEGAARARCWRGG